MRNNLRTVFLISIIIFLVSLCHRAIGSLLSANYISFIERVNELSPESRMHATDMALLFSPNDPMVRYLRGNAYFIAAQEIYSDDLLNKALKDFKSAVTLSPNDFRFWLGYGRALEKSGKSDQAKRAFEKAVNLAPHYFDTQWALGNYLIREGENNTAFTHMNAALAVRPSTFPLVFDYAWNTFDGDVDAIIHAIPPPHHLTYDFITMLINKGKWGKALEIWKSINQQHQPAIDKGSILSNGNFEAALTFNSEIPFNSWRVIPMQNDKISLDTNNAINGKNSLRIYFNDEGNNAHVIAQQIAPVNKKTTYCLSYYVKTEGLESLSTPKVELFDPADGKRAYAESPEVPTRNNGWNQHTFSLTTSPDTDVLMLRIERLPCSSSPCPITGRVWFDNFKLKECAINN